MNDRFLSNHEVTQLAWHTAHFVVKVTGVDDIDGFKSAFALTAEAHPLATSRVEWCPQAGKFAFKRISTADLPVRVFEPAAELHACELAITNSAVDVYKYQVMASLIKVGGRVVRIVFSFSHAIISGRSGFEFVARVLERYEALAENAPSVAMQPCPLPMTHFALQFKPDVPSAPYFDEQLEKKSAKLQFGSRGASSAQQKTAFHDFSIQSELYAAVLQACKLNQVSVNSLLTACQLAALSRHAEHDGDYSHFSHILSIDMRDHIPNSNEYFSAAQFSYAGVFYFEKNVVKNIWALARQVGEGVKAYISSDKLFGTIRALESQRLENYDLNLPVLDDGVSWTSCNSNVGRIFEDIKLRKVVIEDANFCLNRVNGEHLIFICGINCRINLRFTYTEPMIKRSFIEENSAEILRLVEAACSPGSPMQKPGKHGACQHAGTGRYSRLTGLECHRIRVGTWVAAARCLSISDTVVTSIVCLHNPPGLCPVAGGL